MIPPKYADVMKPANDLFGKDFPIGVNKLEVKSKAANGTNFTVNGTRNISSGGITAELTAKTSNLLKNTTITEKLNTSNVFTLELESENSFAKGLKVDAAGSVSLVAGGKGPSLKSNVFFKQDNIHFHLNSDLLNGPVVSSNAILSQNGVLAGAEISYDFAKAQLKSTNLLVGYAASDYNAVVQTSNSFNLVTAAVFQRIQPGVLETASRATVNLDQKAQNSFAKMEVGAKYNLDKTSFIKAKVASDGNMGLAYSQLLRPGVTALFAASANLNNLTESKNTIGFSLTFSA
ncbi:Mitochondrial outer membrane protein porin [Smittium mucronatum]|uniref:Mitochondrial outer membrane protein porin n=1 Tax=Smittium mucronatum TaxID=133383 RepID=A0A1R0GUI9_9FUNG|nr:Mitochondrial outer membrane protein porin [Smittium mucronatum]